MRSGVQIWTVLIAAAILPACAQAPATDTTQFANAVPLSAGPAYALSAEEQDLDCKDLTGRMHVRILQMRGHANKSQPSGISQGIKAVTKTVLGGTAAGADEQYAQSRAQLNAYNGLLATKKCATFDLDKELQARPTAPPPSPTAPAAKPPAAKTAS